MLQVGCSKQVCKIDYHCPAPNPVLQEMVHAAHSGHLSSTMQLDKQHVLSAVAMHFVLVELFALSYSFGKIVIFLPRQHFQDGWSYHRE